MDALKRLLSPRSPLSIRVSLNNDLVLVHPPAQDEDEVGSTMLTGSVVISSPVSIRLATVRVGVVVAAQYSHPDWPKQQDGTIFEQHLSFLGEDAQVTPAAQGLEHRIAFDLPVQSNIPTYEFSEEVKIRAQLRVTVEYWGGPGGTTEVQGRGFIDNAKLNMARWDGGGKVNYPRRECFRERADARPEPSRRPGRPPSAGPGRPATHHGRQPCHNCECGPIGPRPVERS